MADAPSSQLSDPNNPISQPDPVSTSATPPPPVSPLSQVPQNLEQQQQLQQAASKPNLLSPPSQPLPTLAPPSPSVAAATTVLPGPPQFRPIPQFTPVVNSNYQTLGAQTPGVQSGMNTAMTMNPGLVGTAPVTAPQMPMMQYQLMQGQVPNPAMRPFMPMPNGYGAIPPPGMVRYPSPYPAMVRAPFYPRPPGAVGVYPGLPRPLIPGVPGVRPMMPPLLRPAMVPSITPAEKPQTTVYVGKMSSTAENDFMLSILQICGPVKSWKRAQDPTTGTPKSFGFCEFESAEGVLRALRLLTKLSIDGQELGLNVNQATKKYLERYVEKRLENAKQAKSTEAEGSEKEGESADTDAKKNESDKPPVEELKTDSDTGDRANIDIANSGIVTDEDREADQEALEKIRNMIEERLKSKPPPPPPAREPVDASGNPISEGLVKSKNGDSDADGFRGEGAEDKNDDATSSEHAKPGTSSPDRSKRNDRRSRERDRDKREKENEIDRYEREAERERTRKERDQRRKLEDAERAYQNRLRQWERRERDKEKERQYEKEREKEKERKRKKEIRYEEEDGDEEDSRRRWHRSEEKKKRRLWENEDDMADAQKEEAEIAEAKRKAEEEKLQQQQIDPLMLLSGHAVNGSEKLEIQIAESMHKLDVHEKDVIDVQNGTGGESAMDVTTVAETQLSSGAPAKKLGFGLVGSGKRTAVPSVFHVEEEDDAQKDKKMRPLVPIDYSTEELQAVDSGTQPPSLSAAVEFAKRISHVNPKEDKYDDNERERSRRSHDKSGHRDRDRTDEGRSRNRDENRDNKIADRDRDRDHGQEKGKAPDKKKLLDAKQLIDTIPKTKDELFSYEINWTVYDKHQLHERMRPWISKKVMEFLGEEEATLVDYIVSSTQEHVKASHMLELLQSILDEEAEMFVLKMWRMLIFEIKRVEAGLSVSSKV